MIKDSLERFATAFESCSRNQPAGRIALPSLVGSADAYLATTLSLQNRLVLAITPGLPHADRLMDDLQILTASLPVRVLEFPPMLNADKRTLGLRIKTIAALRSWSLNPYPAIIVASFQALAAPIPFHADPVTISPETTAFNDLISRLSSFGYERLPQVEKEGDFSVRGGIIDFWSPGEEFPTRAEFFGEEMESLRLFDPANQISIERISSTPIAPVQESRDTDGNARFLYELLPTNSIWLALEHSSYTLPNVKNAENDHTIIFTGDPPPDQAAAIDFLTVPVPGVGELSPAEAHHPELFESARKHLDQHLSAASAKGDFIARIDDLSRGFELPSFIVVTKADRVFTKKKLRGTSRGRFTQGQRLNDFDDLEPGEYVVHVDHGIGRYIGSSEIIVNGERTEVFTVEYADNGKLHVPAAHAHLLSRYVGVKGEEIRLHKLDGKRWNQDKKDAQKAITDLAIALLETQAKRSTIPGFSYDVNCDGKDAFYASFPYEETPDQLAAVSAIETDLSSSKPMDRLICGDAGYGKTEVAMRAAFIAAMNGKQVAVLAPTTVLVEQHFETFTARFDGTPIRIESISRFQSSGTHSGTFKRLESGACDILIGTHAILSDKIKFHDLGLVIIDEEQRFGVRHKEFLKSLRSAIDVLTLSATPIPRTLYLSMTGARDLSLLRTPPRERVAVDTHVIRDNDVILKNAINDEIARGGQLYFLHNRVMTIPAVERRLKTICPNVRIVSAHGQMDAKTLARKMRDFEQGNYDILLSTTIIESGIDIPRANTIFIDRADTFGIADLYQLRGRVGRSSKKGHAYFLLPPSGDIDSDARERLSALKRHGGLGAGFNLAVRDLELRGAGNLLGSQQSGHIASVGFNLYCQLLQRTIAIMKGERVKDIIDVRLNLDFAMPRLSFNYIEEDIQRLSLMKRFAEAQDESTVRKLAAEMKDRYGTPPPEAAQFVTISRLRAICATANIAQLDVKETRAVFYKNGSHEIFLVTSLSGKTPEAKLKELIRTTRSLREAREPARS